MRAIAFRSKLDSDELNLELIGIKELGKIPLGLDKGCTLALRF